MSEDLAFYEIDIQEKRKLPYTITVEKVENNIIYVHNQWGNDLKYKIVKDDYELIKEDL